jgi:uncharacterized membrane protein
LSVVRSSGRIVFLDWLRGVAAIIMLQGHVFHSFTRLDQRGHGFYIYSQFMGGQAAAMFLFLTGITFGLGIERRDTLSPWRRVGSALKRARYLFLLAILFRLQLYLTGWGHTRAKDLLQVDVLNLMGVATAILSLIALAPDRRARFRWALLAGALMAGLAPLISDADTSWLPFFVRDYVVPGAWFSIFPWGSFLAFGLACGSLIPDVRADAWGKVVQWGALVGFGLILLGLYCSQLPFSIYPSADFWVDSPALIACKMGTTLLVAAVAYLWTEHLHPGPGFVTLLGTTSLAVYWVHIELVYGNAFWFYKERLMPWQSALACIALITLMTLMSWAIRRFTPFLRGRRSHRDRASDPQPA